MILSICPLWNEIEETVKDEFYRRLPKAKEQKKANWMSELTVGIAKKRNLNQESNLIKNFQRALRRHKEQY